MQSDELYDALHKLKLTQADLAQVLDYTIGHMNAIFRDRSPVPRHLELIIKLMLDVPGAKAYLFPWKPDDTKHVALSYEEA